MELIALAGTNWNKISINNKKTRQLKISHLKVLSTVLPHYTLETELLYISGAKPSKILASKVSSKLQTHTS